jgi:hypothetical protein
MRNAMRHITFAHIKSESTDDYYFALPGHYSIGDEDDCLYVREIASRLTGEDEDLLYVKCLSSVSTEIVDVNLLW